MKRTAKLLALVLALCLVFCLAACGTTEEEPEEPAANSEEPVEEPSGEESGEPAADIEWPERNITMVVGYAAGGDTDLAARILADAMSRKLGVSVIVENLAGGSAVVGRTDLISNPGDGYTLMFDQPGSPITQVLLGNTTYSIEEGGTPVALVGISPCALCVAADNSKGIATMDDFIAYAKDHPGELTYAIPGQFTSAHLACLSAFDTLGIEVTSVPTDGTATCVTEVLGDHVDAMMVPYSGAEQYLTSGDMICLGLSAASEFDPDAPLLTDYEGISEYNTWYGIWASNDLDPALTDYISSVIGEILEDEEIAASMYDLGIELSYGDAQVIQDTVTEYTDIISDALTAAGILSE